MSNHLAVATASAGLRSMVEDAAKSALSGVGITVQNGRPDTVQPQDGAAAVSVFLYQVSANAAWRNDDLPTRRRNGDLVARPQAALDLYFLLTFFGEEVTQQPERLLGGVISALHSRPILTRQRIEDVIVAEPHLAPSDLAEQIELVRFVPMSLNLEELSKLWSVFFQTPYRLSVVYQGQVVLIEPEADSPRPTLPVRLRNIYVETFRQPVIESAGPESDPSAPVEPGVELLIRGYNLKNAATRVTLGGEGGTPTSALNTEVRIQLAEPPFAAGEVRAGIRPLQVVHAREMGTPPEEHPCGVTSNVWPLVVRPALEQVVFNPGPPNRVISATIEPEIGPRQVVELLLNDGSQSYGVRAESRASDTDTAVFHVPDVDPAEYFVRLRVDGAESSLAWDPVAGFTGPKVTVTP